MKIAIEGCAHGELEAIYDTITHLMEKDGIVIDLLICCGDFQCPRNERDMKCMHMPEKYLKMGSFYKYYSGEKVVPVPTLFVHGNHECVNYLKELYFGGWVAPNIYYMGYSGVINFGGIRIGGLSGIYNQTDYHCGHHERPPYRGSSGVSSYHVREFEVFKLSQIVKPVDIMLSHDWPMGIYHYGDTADLLRKKPFFRSEVETNTLGSFPAKYLLEKIKPRYWFSAHLHVKFAALKTHPDGSHTKFLALDKCLPGRNFLQIVDVEPSASNGEACQKRFFYDEEWISILKASAPIFPSSNMRICAPIAMNILEDIRVEVQQQLEENSEIPLNFEVTVPPYNPSATQQSYARLSYPFDNPQTRYFMSRFGIQIPTESQNDSKQDTILQATSSTPIEVHNPDEINLDDDDDDNNNSNNNDSGNNGDGISNNDSGNIVIDQ